MGETSSVMVDKVVINTRYGHVHIPVNETVGIGNSVIIKDVLCNFSKFGRVRRKLKNNFIRIHFRIFFSLDSASIISSAYDVTTKKYDRCDNKCRNRISEKKLRHFFDSITLSGYTLSATRSNVSLRKKS